jgi:hypothetical protein
MFKKIFLISCAVLGIAGLPQYAQDISQATSNTSAQESARDSGADTHNCGRARR